jgi:serine/threonine protein kinase
LDPESLRPADALPFEKPGDRIGRYEILEQIGEGGCGAVYLASQEQPVRRQVALKVIKLGMDTKSVIARFEAERQALALMDHPHIAKVFDAGTTTAGRPYFVMEWVRGIKITDYCDQNHLSTHERLELFVQVCQAIQHAHQKGIIHRDIKPSNILVTLQDGVPVPKVIDFGIAKATHGKLTDQTFFTACEQFIGTPAYMSPEQAEARAMDVDTRSDIYSLGVLLYELLTGQTPFDARELMQAGLDEIRRTIREREPICPSTRLGTLPNPELRTIAENRKIEVPQLIHLVNGDLDWIVMKALEKDRTRRFETANGLAADIRRHLNNEPVMARPPSASYRFQKLVRRHRLVFAAAAAVGLALAVGMAISVWALIREHDARLEADRQRLQTLMNEQKAQAEAAKSRQVAQFLEDMLKGVGPSVALGADTTLLKKILDNTAKRVETDLAQQPDVEAELCYTLGEVYWEVGDLADAEAMHRRALRLRVETRGGQDPLVAQSLRRLAHVLWRRGSLEEAEGMATAGVAMQRQLYGNTNLEVARSLEDLAAILATKNKSAAADGALREAVKTKETLLGDTNLEVADSLDDLAYWDFSRRMKRAEADDLAQRAIAIRRQVLGPTNLLITVSTLKLQAANLDIQGRAGDEEATLYQLLVAERQLYGNEHPSLAQSLNQLASVLKTEGKLAAAEPLRREALSIQRQLLGEENPEVAQTLSNWGNLLAAENKWPDAELSLRDAFTIREKIFGDNNPLTATSLTDWGQLLEMEGRLEDARNLYLEKADGKSAVSATAQFSLGVIYLHGQGVPPDPAKAIKWLRKSADQGDTSAQIDLGILNFNGTGTRKNETKALEWFHKAAKQGSMLAINDLANCYCAAGRSWEAMATLKGLCEAHPKDMDAWLTLAVWQVWFGDNAGYESTRDRVMESSSGTSDALTTESAVRVYCLQPSTNADRLAQALALAHLGVDLRTNTPWLPRYQRSLGLAEYRNHDYINAEQTLAAATQTLGDNPDATLSACLLHVLSLFQLGRTDEARQLLTQTEARMPFLPSDPLKPVIEGQVASRDVIIGWLLDREAKAMMSEVAK